MKRQRLVRFLIRAVASLVLPILVGAALVYWMVTTDRGTQFAFRHAGRFLPGALTVGSLRGKLGGPLQLSDLRWKTKELDVTIQQLALTWDPRALLHKRLDIARLEADHIQVVSSAPRKAEPERLPDLHLPFNVIVRSARVRDLRVISLEGDPLVVDSIDMATRADGDLVHVDRLAVRSPTFLLDASGDLRPVGDYPVRMQAAWFTVRPDGSPLGGRATLGGSFEHLELRHELTAPTSICFDGRLDKPLRDLRFDGVLALDGTRIRDFDPAWPDATLTGTLNAKGKLDQFKADGTMRVLLRGAEVDRADAAFGLDRNGQEWTVRRLDLSMPDRPTGVSLAGKVLVDGTTPRFDLSGEWRQAVWPLKGKPTARSPRGRIKASGTLEAYKVEVEGDVAANDLPPGHWLIAGSGDRKSLQVATLRTDALGGSLSGSGKVAWSPEITWDLALAGERLDPGASLPSLADWRGRIDLAAATRGRLAKGGNVVHLEVKRSEGVLRGQPFSAVTELDLLGERTVIHRLNVKSGSSTVVASGEVGPQSNLTFKLDSQNIASLVPQAAGALSASGSVTGPRRALHVKTSFEGRSLAWDTQRAATLKGTADVDLQRGGRLAVDVAGTGLVLSGRPVETLKVVGIGTRARHRITLSATGTEPGKPTGGDVTLEGGLDDRLRWSGTLARFDFSGPRIGAWQLEAPASLTASKEAAQLTGFKWRSADAHLGGNVSWRKSGATDVDASLERLPLTLVTPFLPPSTKLSGTVDGHAVIAAGADGSLKADVRLVPSPGEIRYPGPDGRELVVQYHDAVLQLQTEGPTVIAKAGLAVGADGRIDAEVVSPRGALSGLRTRPITGHVTLSLPDVSFAQAFLEGTQNVKGSVTGDLKIAGTSVKPALTGQLALAGAQADLPEYGIHLREIGLVARARGDSRLALSGSARSGPGTATLEGDVDLTASAPWTLKLRGERFEALHTADSRALVTPHLDVVMTGQRFEVTGDVTVPEATIGYEKKYATVRVSQDVVIVGTVAAPVKPSRQLHARVRLILGERVKFKGSGFDTQLEGSLLAIEEPGRLAMGSGELRLNGGTYKAYGQDLTIEHGRLVFAGPLDDPGVDAQAYRRARDGVLAGINIKGTLKTPEVSVYSDPAMSQGEALAYLLLGHPLGEANEQEGGLVANAATSLGLKGGNLLAKKVAARFGLEEARLEAKEGYESTKLVVAKYFSPRFYVQYGIGLFDRVSTIRVNYEMSRRWTLRAETGAGNAADILYTVQSRH